MNLDLLWTKVLNQIKDEISSISYQTWFSETKLYKLDNNKAYIIVPMPIHKKHLQDNYYNTIVTKLDNITNSSYELFFYLDEEISTLEIEKEMENDKKKNLDTNSDDKFNINSNLKPEYNFDNFIVGYSNKFAHAAALSVAENPTKPCS